MNLSKRILRVREQFLEYLANGRYREAESFLVSLKIKAKAEHDKNTYYAVTHFLGICYQQEGRLGHAARCLAESGQDSSDPVLSLTSKLHLGKVYSQKGDYAEATGILAATLEEISALEDEGQITPLDASHLKLPVLWRLGVERTLIGHRRSGERFQNLHEDLSGNSPYQIANALACRAILFAGSVPGIKFEAAAESLQEASRTYISAPDDETTSFAFRDKAFIGMILLEAVLDFHAGRKFSSYIKLHLVRHYMILWGILPSSEGFAEMIHPALSTFPPLLQFLSVNDRLYERWVSKQHDAKVYLEARGYAAELIRIMETSGKTGYRTELSAINAAVLGHGKRIFASGPRSFEVFTRGHHSLRSSMRLTGNQRRQLSDALIEAFPSRSSLRQMVRFGLDENIEAIAGGDNLKDIAFNLIEWSEANDRSAQLIVVARNENPRNLVLRSFAEEIGLAPSSSEVESVVLKSVGFTNVAEWRDNMIRRELAVCRVEIPVAEGIGTAFLLSPEIAMTNYHVIEAIAAASSSPDQVVLRFDYKRSSDGSTIAEGKEYRLVQKDWLVDYSPTLELDYALVRIDGAPGNEPIAGQEGAPHRGWLSPGTYQLTKGDPLLIIQHPQADPLKLTVGSVVDLPTDGRRVRYSANTLPGSSGSPCFTANWELVALHRAGEPSHNEGIPFVAIMAALSSRVSQLLGSSAS